LSSGVVAVVAGNNHTCALTIGAGLKCWGLNKYGQLGDGTNANKKFTPIDVSGLSSGVVAVAVGNYHTCALTIGGGVKCWGWNLAGQLGDGTTTDRSQAVAVIGLNSGVNAIATTSSHSCALTSSDTVKCWGYNSNGQLGDGTKTDRLKPVDVLLPVVAVNYVTTVPVSQTKQINLAAGYSQSLTVQSYTQGAHGGVSCTNPGLCTYTPQPEYAGLDSFQYTADVGATAPGDGADSFDGPTAIVTGTVSILVARNFVYLPLLRK
jgi:hypothetical protein